MRRIVLFLLSFVMMAASVARPVDSATARRVAEVYLQAHGMQYTSALVDITAQTPFTEFYIFAAPDGGFILVSGDDRVVPVLGYSVNEPFDAKHIPENAHAWFEDYERIIRAVRTSESEATATGDIAQQWQSLLDGEMPEPPLRSAVAPLMTTTWAQNPGYNALCPADSNGSLSVTGCVPTATAQIMKYWNWPPTGYGSRTYTSRHSAGYIFENLTADFGNTTYQWDSMPNALNNSSSSGQINAVATLMYHVGVAQDIGYSPIGSGAYEYALQRSLIPYFKYCPDMYSVRRIDYDDTEYTAMLYNEIDHSRPIFSAGGAHGYVFDGYDSTGRFHVNWGWGGYLDGYYYIGFLTPDTTNERGQFSAGNNSVLNIRPNRNWDTNSTTTITVNSNGHGSVSGSGNYAFGDTVTVRAVTADAGYRFSHWTDRCKESPRSFISSGGMYSFTAIFDSVAGDTLHYCPGNHNILVYGYSGTSTWGIKLPARLLPPGKALTDVQAYIVRGGTYRMTVYTGDNNIIATETDTMVYNDSTDCDRWHTIHLSTPVTTNRDVWIIFRSEASFPVACTYSSGVAESMITGFNDSDMHGLSGNNNTAMIKGIFGIAPQTNHIVTVQSNDSTGGSVTGGGTYTHGSVVTLTASPVCGYRFTQWSDSVTDNPRTFFVTGDTTVTAEFATGTTKVGIPCSTGQMLYYNLDCTNHTAMVTYPGDSTNAPYNGHTQPVGNVVIPDSITYDSTNYTVTAIGEYAFSSCGGLTGLTIPNTVTTIGSFATIWCGLVSATIPNSVTSIDGFNFYGCPNLVSLHIGSSLSSIGAYMAFLCNNLTTIVVDSSNRTFDSRDSCNAIIRTSNNTLIAGCKNSTIPNTVTTIGFSAFRECSITSMPIPNSVTSIDSWAFANCSLTTLDIPASVTSIGSSAFQDCSSLDSITSHATVPPTLGSNAFSGVDSATAVLVPCNTVTVYQSDANWNRFSNIQEYNSNSYATDSATACDSYTWNGNTYTASVTIADTLALANGCDSITTLYLTINHSSTGVDTVTACNAYVWHGTTYTDSVSTLTDTTINAAGCDSVTTLHLTILACTTTELSACDSYTWHDSIYTIGGTYIDGTDTLILTINHSNSAHDSVTACNAYVWHGTTYTDSVSTPTDTTTNAAGCDSVTTLHLAIIACSTTEIAVCDSYTWHDSVYTADGTYAVGTDTLILTILHSSAVDDTATACNSYTWHGTTYTASTDSAIYRERNAAGCDSVTTLHLTVNYSDRLHDTVTACDSYTWHGTEYTASTDTATYTDSVGAGCGAVTTLHLTINHSTTGIETVSACNSYIWHGRRYRASTTTPTFTSTNAAGCDSVTTLHLTINSSNTGIEAITACDSYTWHGNTYTASTNRPTDTSTNAAGCDSVTTLHLTVHYSNTGTETVTACNSYTWHGTTYTTSTDRPTHTSTNAAGCDSVTTLHLTVLACSTTEVTACDSYTWHGRTFRSSHMYIADHDTLLLTINHSSRVTDTVTACDSYTWFGHTYTASTNRPADTILNAAGCDSITTLNLTILRSSNRVVNVTTCDTFTWNGTQYTRSDTHSDTTTNAVGCDSVTTLNLTVNYSNTDVDVVSACDSTLWHGTTYTASTTAPTFTCTNAAGCDSVTTLFLTVNHSETGTLTVRACDSYTWHRITYTASTNTPTYPYSTAAGCDSIVTLHLTIDYSSTLDTFIDACESYTWYGTTYTDNTTYSRTGTNAAGCDSVTTLHLTIHHNGSSTIRKIAEYSFTWHGTTYTESGTYVYHTVTEAGCDSTITLHLTILTDDEEDGIGSVDALDAKVYPSHGQIVVEGADGNTVMLYDMTGRILATKRDDRTTLRFDIPASGTYMIKIGNHPVRKVVVIK